VRRPGAFLLLLELLRANRCIATMSAMGSKILLAAALACAACSTQKKQDSRNPWSGGFTPPETLDTARVHLEPLNPKHTQWDYDAFMGSRRHLHDTLHWGSWPRPDFTLEDNREDLTRHFAEFEAREAYAYTVQDQDRTHCVGCIYINPPRDRKVDVPAPMCVLAFWVIEPELKNDLDLHLVASTLDWIQTTWPYQSVLLPIHKENKRGHEIMGKLGISQMPGETKNYDLFVWSRAARGGGTQ
jgi:hypothetical protein